MYPLRDEADKVIKVAGDTLQQAAARLGVITLTANAHLVEGVKEDGTKYSMTKRDSSAMPKALAKARDEAGQRTVAALVAKKTGVPAPLRVAEPLVPLTLAQARGKKRRSVEAAKQRADNDHLALVVAESAARGTPQPESAAGRLSALRLRVLAKQSRLDTG